MGKAAKDGPAEAVEFPSNVYGIFPKALSELSEVSYFTESFNLTKNRSLQSSSPIWCVICCCGLQRQPYLCRRNISSRYMRSFISSLSSCYYGRSNTDKQSLPFVGSFSCMIYTQLLPAPSWLPGSCSTRTPRDWRSLEALRAWPRL